MCQIQTTVPFDNSLCMYLALTLARVSVYLETTKSCCLTHLCKFNKQTPKSHSGAVTLYYFFLSSSISLRFISLQNNGQDKEATKRHLR